MSDATFPRRTKFGDRVRKELDSQKLSIRKLARKMDPERPEVAKRNLARWIGGYNSPSRISRIAVAEALGLRPEELLDDDDEEEDDPLVALMSVLRRVVREELAKERVE